METNKDVERTVEYITKMCHKHSIQVARIDSKNSASVYLKFNQGILGGMRISDHPPKPQSNYKYNLTLDTDSKRIVNPDGYVRYFAHLDSAHAMFKNILLEQRITATRTKVGKPNRRKEKRMKWGNENEQRTSY